MRYSKMLVTFIVAIVLVFTVATLYLFYKTGSEPTALIGCFFAFFGTEMINLALIKVKKVKNGVEVNPVENESGDV